MNITVMEKAREIAAKFRANITASSGVVRLLDAKKNEKNEGELFIYAPIGASWWADGVTAQQVVDKLEELKGVKKLSVRINSEGGDIWDGKAIENAIRRFESDEKVTYIDGLCASAATFIAMATPRIVSAANATWMVHEAATVAGGRASDLRAMADVLEKENRTIAETYSRRTGKPAEECLAMMAAETWMTASEAVEHGFSDEMDGDECEPQKKAAAATPLKIAATLRETEARVSPASRAASARARARVLSEKFSGVRHGEKQTASGPPAEPKTPTSGIAGKGK